jgi:hypothetical protein
MIFNPTTAAEHSDRASGGVVIVNTEKPASSIDAENDALGGLPTSRSFLRFFNCSQYFCFNLSEPVIHHWCSQSPTHLNSSKSSSPVFVSPVFYCVDSRWWFCFQSHSTKRTREHTLSLDVYPTRDNLYNVGKQHIRARV